KLTRSHNIQNNNNNEGYNSEAPKILFLCKDSFTNFDSDNYNVPFTPAKKKKKKNKSAFSISQIVVIHHSHHNYNHKSHKNSI
ncbi:3642_t:CDS:2, partial [Gigaspora margarita]